MSPVTSIPRGSRWRTWAPRCGWSLNMVDEAAQAKNGTLTVKNRKGPDGLAEGTATASAGGPRRGLSAWVPCCGIWWRTRSMSRASESNASRCQSGAWCGRNISSGHWTTSTLRTRTWSADTSSHGGGCSPQKHGQGNQLARAWGSSIREGGKPAGGAIVVGWPILTELIERYARHGAGTFDDFGKWFVLAYGKASTMGSGQQVGIRPADASMVALLPPRTP